MRPILYRIGYQDETQLLNWVKVHPQLGNNNGHIQWMVHWWVPIHGGPENGPG
jgi:hypothetical protein